MLNAAIEDGLLSSNPAANLGRSLKLTASPTTTQEVTKAMTMTQRQQFLATACQEAPRFYLLFFVLAGTGMRLGEALALQWEDINCEEKTIRIARALSEDGTVGTPKSGHGRTVEISQHLANVLAAQETIHQREYLLYQWRELPPWVFVTQVGTPFDPSNVRRTMRRILQRAKLPQHFTPHCLRHTYASILVSEGVSVAYVQEQLGHASIDLTVSTYGRWLKKRAPGVLDRLDAGQAILEDSGGSGSKVVATLDSPTESINPLSHKAMNLYESFVEPTTRIERATCCLRNSCSTN
ncbi:MAG: hypothetical protein RL768_859 [Nitrospirota bacterium]